MLNSISDYMSDAYTPFEQNLALAWAQAHLAAYLSANPNCSFENREKEFLDALEGGLRLALKFRESNT